MIETYEIGPNNEWIKCLVCGMTSHNPNDVEQKYCGNCHEYHDLLAMVQRLRRKSK